MPLIRAVHKEIVVRFCDSKMKSVETPFLELKATSLVTPIKPAMSNRASQEAFSSNAPPQVNVVKRSLWPLLRFTISAMTSTNWIWMDASVPTTLASPLDRTWRRSVNWSDEFSSSTLMNTSPWLLSHITLNSSCSSGAPFRRCSTLPPGLTSENTKFSMQVFVIQFAILFVEKWKVSTVLMTLTYVRYWRKLVVLHIWWLGQSAFMAPTVLTRHWNGSHWMKTTFY